MSSGLESEDDGQAERSCFPLPRWVAARMLYANRTKKAMKKAESGFPGLLIAI